MLYFIYIVFYSVTPSTFRNLTSDLPDQDAGQEMSLSKIIEKIVADHDTESQNVSESEHKDMKVHSKDVPSGNDGWTGLTKYHWPQLLSYYNTSLLGR